VLSVLSVVLSPLLSLSCRVYEGIKPVELRRNAYRIDGGDFGAGVG